MYVYMFMYMGTAKQEACVPCCEQFERGTGLPSDWVHCTAILFSIDKRAVPPLALLGPVA
jgi:hypothetical protein